MKYFNLDTDRRYKISEGYYQEILDLDISYDYNLLLEEELINKDCKWIIELCKFIYGFKFATLNQIKQYMDLSGNEFEESDINFLIEKNILKRCVLKSENSIEDDSIKEENILYCSSRNLVEILRNYSAIDSRKWMVRDIAKSPERILKNILSLDFYINLVQSYGFENVINVTLNPCQRYMVLESVNIELEFTIKYGDRKECFIVDIVRESDLKTSFLKKILKFERYLSNDACKRSSHGLDKKPKLIFICEDREMLEVVARRLRISSLHINTTVLYTYDEVLSMQFLNGKAAFKGNSYNSKELYNISLMDSFIQESIGELNA
ncbi:hypothetical protein EAI30_06840 [Romboutsia ilealis]|uniref:Uncharacterized protein n=1 Tax=Romboutsia faecis TaxID=2764597 RepID=A0ABR7JKI8_9FIRM|nr:hypothetical protein [Romboutsia faecis]MBC5995429.1 hypothetical protein [Romboutsia faecis]MRN24328.1 hypothetical protein [Romboutsia ilealis]